MDEEQRQGHVASTTPPGTTPTHERATFADPVPENLDPTSPASPESTFSYQHDHRGVQRPLSGTDEPQQNIEDWRRRESD
jgi:hypothetical protein